MDEYVNSLLTYWYLYFLPPWPDSDWCGRVLWNVLIGLGSYVRVQCGKVRFVEITWGWLREAVFSG
jgi:hypothetical protein